MARSGDTALLVGCDEGSVLEGLLGAAGVGVRHATDVADALAQHDERPANMIVASLAPDEVAEVAAAMEAMDVPLVVVGAGWEAAAVAAVLRAGADDFLVDPPNEGELAAVLTRLAARRREVPPPHRRDEPTFGASPAMTKVAEQVERVAKATSTVLLRGETGTGKGVVARALHAASERKGAFIELHCAALPEQLLESELFGYEKGAFTGATRRKPGRVELADGGTLFLDEIGDVSPATQVKLLRLLQDKSFERVGGVQTLTANLRVVAATHQKLEALIARGTFREDLFYRLNVVTLWLPPLRSRRDDIGPLAERFCARIAADNGRPDLRLSDDAIALLRKQRWPGNVRQLENFVERLVVLGEGDVIEATQVRAELADAAPFATEGGTGSVLTSVGAAPQPLTDAVREAETAAIERALAHTKGNRKLAARLLGVSRATLYNKLSEYGIG